MHVKITYSIYQTMAIDSVFSVNYKNRDLLEKIFDSLTLEELLHIPEGFSNNILWNIGHVIAVQQLLVYKRSGIETFVPGSFVKNFAPGTFPSDEITLKEAEEVRSFLHNTIRQTEQDFLEHKFQSYEIFTARSGFVIDNVVKAIIFNNFHEGVHLGNYPFVEKVV